MPNRKLLVSLLSLLAGCSAPPSGPWADWSWPWLAAHHDSGQASRQVRSAQSDYGNFSFDWNLQGDAEIMPVQVFDDGERMWLQFPPGGVWPAVFEAGAGGWRPLSYRSEGPYMVLDRVYKELALRGGHLKGSVTRPRGPEVAPAAIAAAETAAVVAATPAPGVVAALPPAPDSVPTAVPVPGITSMAAPAISPEPAAEPAALGPVDPFSVSPADVTMRQALERWATTAGWTFTPEHWAVDVDIPLVGQASFPVDFRSAVRELLASTEMGDRPLQPCFYSNLVVRVVPLAQPCDRRKGMGVMS